MPRIVAFTFTAAVIGMGAAVLASSRSSRHVTPATPTPAVAAQERAQLARLEQLRVERDAALSEVATQRRAATLEIRRLAHVHGRASASQFTLRYGSDQTGDPQPWVQSGPEATPAPNSSPEAIQAFKAVESAGRILLVGAAKQEEIDRGLIDNRLLQLLTALARQHRLVVNSLRISHPVTVQDELGTPAPSNHVYGRAADISSVDGVPCARETAAAPYHTLLDNPPPANPGPCMRLAYEAAQMVGPDAPGEIIFYFRVPGPAGVSLPNHNDHVHIGFRNYPNIRHGRPSADTYANSPHAPAEQTSSMALPSTGKSHTIRPSSSTSGD